MDSLRTFTVNTAHEAVNRALWPSIVLSVAIALDQYTRGPSLSAMLITAYLNGQLPLS
jgi:hypothetical protein